jgi:4-hydroxybenzoate polyprenyltransferase
VLENFYRQKLHIVACAMAASWAWPRLMGILTTPSEMALVGLLVSIVYGLNRFTDQAEDRINDPESVGTHRAANLLIVEGAALAAFLWHLWSPVCLLISAVALTLGVLYSVRVVYGFRLKQHWLTKNASSAVGWTLLTVVLPVLNHGHADPAAFAVVITYMFSSVLMIEILWDIRDIKGDAEAGIKTLATASEIQAWRTFSLVNWVSFLAVLAFYATHHLPLAWLIIPFSSMLMMVVRLCSGWFLPRLRTWSHHLVSAETALLLTLGFAASGR